MNMRFHIVFFLFGAVLGALIFWIPSVLAGGIGLAAPFLFLSGPWFVDAAPYLAIFAVLFVALFLAYRIARRPFPISWTNGGWMLLGLYVALTFFFYAVAISAGRGTMLL
jgi:hypothetical protein